MNTLERIFQALIFEMIALFIIVPASVYFGGFATGKMAIVGIGLSIFAMLWNYIYNIVFDKIAGHNRKDRSLLTRVTHACGFELGMVVITLPVLAWYLNITWLAAAALEAGFLVFILIYTYIFNVLYDKHQPYKKWVNKSQCA
ncbi:PACE efflux transporter [Pseudoalteromonas sp. SWN29]|uniref:PACE efflux transporter n=1 Tax=Pseudoalteromonas sp. SWN29 TaxID=2792064 RepID=UPI0018CD5685|nr:PACE efflux transporter [Pseudoalteromonas sp. SWN29]MBH0029039.1 PACE efflux transporter [Pseudoalteromonas sp. SWN29]